MNANDTAWVTRAGSRRYSAAARMDRETGFAFGTLVQTVPATGPVVLGLVDEVTVAGSLGARQMVAAGIVDDSFRTWSLLEIGVRVAAWQENEEPICYGLPPQPPLSLATVRVCHAAELLAFSRDLVYLPLLLAGQTGRTDELVIAHLVRAGLARPPEQRPRFVREAGRRLTHLLHRDVRRLEQVLTTVVSGIRAAETG